MIEEVVGIISGSTELDAPGISLVTLVGKCESFCFFSAPKLLKVETFVYESSYNRELNHTIYTEFMGAVSFTQLSLVMGRMGRCPDFKGVLSVLMNLDDYSLAHSGC